MPNQKHAAPSPNEHLRVDGHMMARIGGIYDDCHQDGSCAEESSQVATLRTIQAFLQFGKVQMQNVPATHLVIIRSIYFGSNGPETTGAFGAQDTLSESRSMPPPERDRG